jgi:hypothetical protein
MNSIVSVNKGKIALYAIGDTNVYVDVVYKDETFWMTQKAIAELFDVNVPAISKHIKNVLEDGELAADSTVSILEIVQKNWLSETDKFLYNNRRRILEDKGHISHDAAMKKAAEVYEQFRIQQDRDYISNFDEEMSRYLAGAAKPEDRDDD